MKTRKVRKVGQTIINKLHKLGFSKVTKVVDARTPLRVNVIKQDSVTGRKKDPADCALARACVREKQADGAVINIGVSYIVKDNIATRYKTTAGVGREITSFDRGAGFEEGHDYLLASPSPAMRLDAPRIGKDYEKGAGKPKPNHMVVHGHHTENIRVSKALPKKK